MASQALVNQTQGSVDDDHVYNEKELWVLIPTDPSTNLIHCIYEVQSKVHGVGAAASQSRWPSDPPYASELTEEEWGRSVNLGDPLELKSTDVFRKMLVEDTNGRRCNIEECFGSPTNLHDTD